MQFAEREGSNSPSLTSAILQSAIVPRVYGAPGGGTRLFVACSNAYASAISFGSLHAVPVKLTLNGAGFALKPAGNGGVGALRNRARTAP